MASKDTNNLDSQLFVKAALENLTDKVRLNIKKPLMEMAEKEVDIAVDRALDSLKFDLEHFVSMQSRDHIFNVLVNRIDK